MSEKYNFETGYALNTPVHFSELSKCHNLMVANLCELCSESSFGFILLLSRWKPKLFIPKASSAQVGQILPLVGEKVRGHSKI